ncbi:MAG: stearoyl-CoA desaturase (delta-9 desaturase) [Candidatus Paceibacteria bacterium]|jgi:stearoyl-CoA desaturase (delta-9 desaturase)
MTDIDSKTPLLTKITTLIFLTVPPIAFIWGVVMILGQGPDWTALCMTIAFTIITILGVTVGFHRYFTHSGFSVRYRWLEILLGIVGSMAGQGPLFKWVSSHRAHHKDTDRTGDPHSPNLIGNGAWNVTKGFFHAHVGWLLYSPLPSDKSISSLKNNQDLVWVNDRFLLWVFLGLVIPPFVGILIRGHAYGILLDLLWGGLIRLFFVQHITFFVNSWCHIWGDKPFKLKNRSTNSWFVACFALGEGWHNCHHAFQKSAKQGLLGLQWLFDFSWHVICLLKFLRLIENVHVPSKEDIRKKLAA